MDDTQTQTQVEAEGSTKHTKLIIWLGVGAVIVGTLFWWWQNGEKKMIMESLQSTITKVRGGDLLGALEDSKKVVSSPLSSADEKALAELSTAAIPFRTTGDEQFLLAHIPVLKSIIENPDVSLSVRVIAINTLASAYCGSGRRWKVFGEIYKGEPYSKFLAQDDPDASSRNMFEWSYGQYPTSDAAMLLARSYASQAFIDVRATSTVAFDLDIGKAKSYLAAAKELEIKEQEAEPDFFASQRYAIYLYWRAYTTASLAYFEGGAYRKDYKTEYENFINTYSGKGILQYNYVPYAHMLYAYFLILNDNATEKARKQLIKIEPIVKSDPYYDTNQFVRFVHNERWLRRDGIRQGPFTSAILVGKQTSRQFTDFVNGIE